MMIPYTVTRKRVKHVTLRISSQGELEITAPRSVSEAELQRIIVKKEMWIRSKQKDVRQRQEMRQREGLHNRYADGGTIAYLGKNYPLQVQTAGVRGWNWNGEQLVVYGCRTEQQVKSEVEEFYREMMAEQILPALNHAVRYRMQDVKLPDPQLLVRKMRARWGTCYSESGKIILNLWLAMAPEECIRQVLTHEYVHFLQNNHSVEFYRLLERFEPQHRQLQEKLSVLVDLREDTL